MKTKFIKKVTAGLLLAPMCLSIFACGGGGSENGGAGSAPSGTAGDETVINLYYKKTGNGLEYLNKIITAFEAAHPEYKIALDYDSDGKIASTITLGEEYNYYDLYMETALTADYNKYLEPLNDVLDSYSENETVTIRDKFNQTYLSGMKASDSDTFYYLSYGGGYVGLVYNADYIGGIPGTFVPNTTDEMLLLASLVDSKTNMFISFNRNRGYWTYHDEIWQAQYDGLEYYNETFLKLKGATETPSKDVFKTKDGRYQVLKLQEKLQNNSYVEASSFQDEFSDAQTKFLSGKGAIMVNGTWLRNEMGENSETMGKFKMMRTPVISSIIDVCPDKSIADDTELSALVAAVDEAETKESVPLSGSNEIGSWDVTRADADRIYDARNLVYSTHNEQAFVIPNYANCKEGAKAFMKFYYSDAMIDVYEDTLKMPSLLNRSTGEGRDTSTWSEWDLTMIDYLDSTPIWRVKNDQSPMFSVGGLSPYGVSNYQYLFSVKNPNDRKDADTIWTDIMNWADDNWDDCLIKAGIATN